MQRRRFFPAKPVQQVPGRSVELAVQVRKESEGQRLPPPIPRSLQPPYWVGHDSEDGEHTTTLHIRGRTQFILSKGLVFTYFEEGLWIAVVEGATHVDWSIMIKPGYAHGAPGSSYGDDVTLELSSALGEGPQALSVVYLDSTDPTDELDEWGRRWEVLNRYQLDLPIDKFGVPRIWHPRFAAVSNVLIVSLHDPRATIPCRVTAVANVEGIAIGEVELLLGYQQ